MRENQVCPCLRRWLHLFLGCAGLVILSGCGDGKIARYPVTGTVLVDGQPADGALVVFVPEKSSEEAKQKRPTGFADASGSFQLTTIDKNDGAPAGEYKVLIMWPQKTQASSDESGQRRGKLGPDRLKGRYFVEDSPITAAIEEKENNLPPFQLSLK